MFFAVVHQWGSIMHEYNPSYCVYLIATPLREETIKVGEAHDSNDGTAQCNHHLLLKH